LVTIFSFWHQEKYGQRQYSDFFNLEASSARESKFSSSPVMNFQGFQSLQVPASFAIDSAVTGDPPVASNDHFDPGGVASL